MIKKHYCIVLTMLILALFVMPVSADEYINIEDSIVVSNLYSTGTYGGSDYYSIGYVSFATVESVLTPSAIITWIDNSKFSHTPGKYSGITSCSYYYGERLIGTGDIGYYHDIDNINSYIYLLFNNDWNVSGLTGDKVFSVSYNLSLLNTLQATNFASGTGPALNAPRLYRSDSSALKGSTLRNEVNLFNTRNDFLQVISETGDISSDSHVTIYRNVAYNNYTSRIIVKSLNKSSAYSDTTDSSATVSLSVPKEDLPYDVNIYSTVFAKWYNNTLYSEALPPTPTPSPTPITPTPTPTPTVITITVYARDKTTGNLISDATFSAYDAVTGTFTNATYPSGFGSFTFTQKPAGQYYHMRVTAPGYDMFEDGYFNSYDGNSYLAELYPETGTPATPENVYIEFYVRDTENDGIPAARITIDGAINYTSAYGYKKIEVTNNTAYAYMVEKPGYITVSGTINVGASNVVKSVIMPMIGEVPTATPTLPANTTPTVSPPSTVPAGNESYIDETARNFGIAFGTDFETGKLLLGTILSLAIGMIVARKLRGGAAEFGIGMLGGIVLSLLIGLIPIWVVVVLILIVGFYIGIRIMGAGGAK